MRVGGAATAVKTVAVTSNRRNKVIGGEVGRCGGRVCFESQNCQQNVFLKNDGKEIDKFVIQ
jgi:hypothetical protein